LTSVPSKVKSVSTKFVALDAASASVNGELGLSDDESDDESVESDDESDELSELAEPLPPDCETA
jgi:hypothetical protein